MSVRCEPAWWDTNLGSMVQKLATSRLVRAGLMGKGFSPSRSCKKYCFIAP